jgi:hypothetical protein
MVRIGWRVFLNISLGVAVHWCGVQGALDTWKSHLASVIEGLQEVEIQKSLGFFFVEH